MATIELDLEMATNLWGSLNEEYKDKLRDLHEEPTPEKWGDCHGIILSSEGPMVTLWEALLVVDRANTPSRGPAFGMGEEPEWDWCPTPAAIRQALAYATR